MEACKQLISVDLVGVVVEVGLGIGKNFDEDLKKWIINNVPVYWQGSVAALLIQSTLIM